MNAGCVVRVAVRTEGTGKYKPALPLVLVPYSCLGIKLGVLVRSCLQLSDSRLFIIVWAITSTKLTIVVAGILTCVLIKGLRNFDMQQRHFTC